MKTLKFDSILNQKPLMVRLGCLFFIVFTLWMTDVCSSNIGPRGYFEIVKYEYIQQKSREQYIPTELEVGEVLKKVSWDVKVGQIVILGASSYEDLINRADIASKYLHYYEHTERYYKILPYILWPFVGIWLVIAFNFKKLIALACRLKNWNLKRRIRM